MDNPGLCQTCTAKDMCIRMGTEPDEEVTECERYHENTYDEDLFAVLCILCLAIIIVSGIAIHLNTL